MCALSDNMPVLYFKMVWFFFTTGATRENNDPPVTIKFTFSLLQFKHDHERHLSMTVSSPNCTHMPVHIHVHVLYTHGYWSLTAEMVGSLESEKPVLDMILRASGGRGL